MKIDIIQRLCALHGPSGDEGAVRAFIIDQLPAGVAHRTDPLGNLIVTKRGDKPAKTSIMLCAHMDEVGFMVTNINEDGTLEFSTIGGINANAILGRRVKFSTGNIGVFGVKPVHLCESSEREAPPNQNTLYVDIGAKSREQALTYCKPGDTAVFESEFSQMADEIICSKAIDDRIGCAILLDIMQRELPFDMTFLFTAMEEIGCKGAKVATRSIRPDAALIIEATTAADTPLTKQGKGEICGIKKGVAISFMDGGTVYDREYYGKASELAIRHHIPHQPKAGTTGGNDAAAIHVSGSGVRTLALNVPCRYLHTASGVAALQDAEACAELAYHLACEIAGGSKA